MIPGQNASGKNAAKVVAVEAMIGQAIPSLVPYKAASYFHKTECFCFNSQPLQAGESAELGLSFIVDIDIPKYVKTITLSYTIFDITESLKDVTQIENTPATLALVSIN